MLVVINEPEINKYFNNRVTEIVSEYLLDIASMSRHEEFIGEIVGLVKSIEFACRVLLLELK